jgi:hypothetical protein
MEETPLPHPPADCTSVIGVAVDEFTVMLSACVAVAELASVTSATKLHVPAVVGVPDIVPLVLSVRPGGKLPDCVQEYGVVPPVAVNAAVYVVPAVPVGSDVVVIVSGAALVIGVVENVATAALQFALLLSVNVPANIPADETISSSAAPREPGVSVFCCSMT